MRKNINSLQEYQDKFASLEGTTGSFFITVFCETVQKLVWLTIYLSAKI